MLTALSRARNADRFGGKAARLGECLRLGWPVPGGFVIPDHALQSHLSRAGVVEAAARCAGELPFLCPQELADTGARISAGILATALDPALRKALARRFDGADPGRAFVVRSSAVGEDGSEASFAGQLESRLDVRSLVALEEAVIAVWASLWSPRSLLYAQQCGAGPARMGVLVQEQVQARLSGVLFTRDPSGRHPQDIVVEYCAGLGDRLVGGLIDPAQLLISRVGLHLRQGHDAQSSLPLEDRDAAAIRRLAEIALAAESRFAAAQDVEWCIDAQRRPFVLQARPVTRIQGEGGQAPRIAHWSNANIAENYPHPVSPFLYSIARPAYAAYFRGLARGLGMPAKALRSRRVELANLVGLQGGRLYYNVSNIHAVQQLMPSAERLHRYLGAFVGTTAAPAPPRIVRPRGSDFLLRWRVFVRSAWSYAGIEWRIRHFERCADRFARGTHPSRLAAKPAWALAQDLRGFLDIRMRCWNGAALADNAAMMCYGALQDRLAGVQGNALHNALLTGLPGLASTVPVQELWKLSQMILRDAGLVAAFTGGDCEDTERALAGPAHREFRDALERYLDEWGFRFSEELMLTGPTPQEDPRPILRLLRSYVQEHAPDPAQQIAAQRRIRERETCALQRNMASGAGRLARWVAGIRFRLLLWATHAAIRYRERARMKQALLYTRLRHIALNVGERLVERGVLRSRDDIFLLTTGEALSVLEAPAAPDLRNRLESRRRELEEAASLRPPDHIALPERRSWRPVPHVEATLGANAGARLSGLGASSGRATGEASVLMNVSEAGELRAGQILVTRQTDPGWAAVFYLAAGLVVERGGLLSHGAIIAREYGIPAVVGVPGATGLIPNGATVEVDGSGGEVRVHAC